MLIARDFSAAPVEGIVNAFKKRLRVKRLEEETDGPAAQYSRANGIVGIGRNEDRRNAQSQVG
jgi:hypothetical protein